MKTGWAFTAAVGVAAKKFGRPTRGGRLSGDELDFAPDSVDQVDNATPYAFIQWKGTDACMDFYCRCGAQHHFDGEFAYYYRCKACGLHYKVGSYVALYEMTTDEVADQTGCPFVEGHE